MTRWHSVVICAAAGVALTLGSVGAQPPQVKRPADQVFRAAVEMVSLNVTVTDQKQHYLTDLESKDFGATWTRYTEWFWPGSVDIGDGSGVRITNISSYAGKDRFYVIGTEKDDLTIVDSFYNKGGFLRCSGPTNY